MTVKVNILNYIKKVTYIKEELDAKFNKKADTDHEHGDLYYTETETDTLLNGKANSTHNHAISDVTNLQTTLDGKASTDVATASKNGLMSSSDKSKLDGISEEANKTIVDSSLSATSTNPLENKAIKSALDGKSDNGHKHNISDVTNLQTTLDGKASSSHSHTGSEITVDGATLASKISTIESDIDSLQEGAFDISIVTSLPETGKKNVLYFKENNSSEADNAYDEYAWNGTKFEKLGTKSIDLSDYVKKSELGLELNETSGELSLTGVA